jgi:hypothetical protein
VLGSLGHGRGEGGRSSPAETAVRPLVVVDGSRVSGDRLASSTGVECPDREHLVADAGAERLHERVLPRGARLEEAALGPAEAAPVAHALAVISGPLSIRTSSGPAPRSRTIWSSTRVVWSASIEQATRIASASRVYSSTAWSSFSMRPSLVVSNWKSKARRSCEQHRVCATGSEVPFAISPAPDSRAADRRRSASTSRSRARAPSALRVVGLPAAVLRPPALQRLLRHLQLLRDHHDPPAPRRGDGRPHATS